jgi:hypothetical protein
MRADQGDIDAPGDQGFESWIGGRFLEAVEVINGDATSNTELRLGGNVGKDQKRFGRVTVIQIGKGAAAEPWIASLRWQ